MAKLIGDEKAKAAKLGFLDGSTPSKKRASNQGQPVLKKKTKLGKDANNVDEGEDEQNVKVENISE